MATSPKTEYWLSGPVEGITPLLQPTAHALLQARDEVRAALHSFPDTLLWQQPAGVASVAFHLQHLTGVLDRLFAYAKEQQLEQSQLDYLAKEGKEDSNISTNSLLDIFDKQVEKSIEYLKGINPDSLTDVRGVGRKQIPSNVMGLLFHAAEHTMRHTGQLLVTAKVVVQ